MRFIISPLIIFLTVLVAPFTVALAETQAPFGLTWGASVEELKESGVLLQRRNANEFGVRFAAIKLPKALSDMGEALLSFGNNDNLHRIEAIGQDVTNDPDGSRLKARYAALARALTRKYGQGSSRHEIREPFTRANDFLTGISRGFTHWYTDFTADNITVRLEIRATRRGISNYAIVFQHKEADRDRNLLQEKDIL